MMEHKNIYQRILAIMSEVDYIQKGEKTVNNQYRFVAHDQVTAILHPKLVKYGVVVVPSVKSLTQDGNRTSVCLEVAFVNVDCHTDVIRLESWGYGVDSSDKGPGKAVSYAYKYALLKLFCLETGDDPDNDQQTQYEGPTAMNYNDFITVLSKRTDGRFTFNLLGDYLTKLEREKNVSREKIMEQALNPALTERFCKGYETWYDTLNI